jgi:hypothetical protein
MLKMSALASVVASAAALRRASPPLQGTRRVYSSSEERLLTTRFFLALTVFGTCLCVAAAGTESRGVSFNAKGKVRYQFFGDNTNTVLFSGIQNFEADVEGSRWAVKAHAVPEDGHPIEMMCDGMYTYATTTGLTTSRNSPLWPSTAGSIKKDTVPFDSPGHGVACVWLTLASNSYLDAERAGLFSPAWIEINRTESALKGDRFRAQITRLPGKPKLPESIDCWSNGLRWGSSGRDRSPLPRPFNEGYLCFQYRTQSATNFAPLQIPTVSTIDFFLPKPGGKEPADICQAVHVKVTVDEIKQPSERASWQPELTSRTRIQDFRFVSAKPQVGVVAYDTAMGTWPKESDRIVASALRYASDFTRIGRPENKTHTFMRWLILGAMLLLTFVFLAYLVRPRQPAR